MKEDFLHFIWKHKLFRTQSLFTEDGRPIIIHKNGVHNHNAGPDFLEASLSIGEELWLGHVEIHVRASDWNRHGHQHDPAYDNTILHAVYDPDIELYLKTPGDLPVLDLSKVIELNYYVRYRDLNEKLSGIPCKPALMSVRPITRTAALSRMVVNRMERKSVAILDRLEQNGGDWSNTLFQTLAMGFGFKVNAFGFQLMAESISFNTLQTVRESRFQIEALLYGQAGMLDAEFSDSYPRELQNEYSFLRKRFGLRPINPVVWKKSRLRPTNFPVVRISQLAAALHGTDNIVNSLVNSGDEKLLTNLFRCEASSYWAENSDFDVGCKERKTRLGKTSSSGLIINAVVPFAFAYGTYVNRQSLIDQAFELLEGCQPENNKITREWASAGWKFENAQQSQGGIELKNEFCANKKCLNCMIGIELLRTEKLHD